MTWTAAANRENGWVNWSELATLLANFSKALADSVGSLVLGQPQLPATCPGTLETLVKPTPAR
jgi:hypothetical protein